MSIAQLERQTDLNVRQIVDLLFTDFGRKCMLVNELGIISKEGDLEARTCLIEILGSSIDSDILFITACYLLTLENPCPDSTSAVKKFRESCKNAELIEMIDNRIQRR